MRPRKALAALGAVALAGLRLAGCNGDVGSDAGYTESMPMDAAVSAEMPMSDEAGAKLEQPSAPAVTDRSVIRTAYLTMRVEAVNEALDEVRSLVRARNGIIAAESLASGAPGGFASITAQVPADDLQAFLDEVTALGEVDSLDITAQDVTTQVIDLDARIAVLEGSIDRMTDLLAEAQRIEDIIAIESELSVRQAELDSLTSQRTYLSEQVAMSTVTISLSPITQVADVDSPGFLSGLQTGWSAFVALIGFAITALGFLIPFVLVAGLILIPVTVLLVRRSRRTRKVPAWDASGEPSGAPAADVSPPSSSSSPS